MKKNIQTLLFLVPFLALLSGCRTGRIAATTPQAAVIPAPDTLVTESPVRELPYFLTSTGDTLSSLEEEVLISLHPVKRDSIRLMAVGDMMMGTNFPSPHYLPADSGYQLWSAAGGLLRSADLTFGNLEGAILTEGGEQKECKNPDVCYVFRTPDYLAFQYKENGFDLLSTANNHANDFGVTGRKNTKRMLDSLGIAHAGSTEQPYTLIRKKGMTIGFVAFAPNRGTLSLHQTDQAISIVKKLDSLADFVVVSFHAGGEGSKNQHVTRKREYYFGEDRGNVYEFAHTMIDNGADILLGHGPHVVRAVELYNDRLIAYSLGNFLTYGRFNISGPTGYAPILDIQIDGEGKFISGQIHSFIQDKVAGPLKDDKKRAANTMRELSQIDFPENEISIDDSGRIIYLHR
ncbi:MAG: CapA family protein [Cyclobacteriaceae bacterium]|nr:CapA family protein [Cyclobacteriaceae bacterium]